MSRQAIGAVGGILLGLVVLSLPAIGGLEPVGQRALAIIGLAVVFWATEVLAAGITAVLALGLMLAAGVPASVALSGYASSAFWILVSVLFFGHAMDRTGLARRLSYRILLLFRPTYGGIVLAFMLIGFVLALGVPSMTVRTAIILPIAWALVQALGLEPRSPGSALIILSTFEMAVLPGCALLTGALWGPYIAGLFQTAGLELTWLGYARILALPTIAWCLIVLGANFLVLRPGRAAGLPPDAVRAEARTLGPISRPEGVTALIIAASILAWASQPWHRVPAESIGMLALAALFAAGIIGPQQIGTGINWGLTLFIGGMLSVTTVITTYKISAWFGGYIVPAIQPFADRPLLFVVAMTVAVVLMRFIDPVGFITIAAFFLALSGFVPAQGLPPLVLVAAILFPLHIFFFSYQNIWLVMTEGITKGGAFSDGQRLRLAAVFLPATVLSLWLAVLYWRLIGAI